MHLLMPLMDATRMELMVPAITATLLDSTSLDESCTYSTTSIVICMLYAILLQFHAVPTRKTC